MHLGSERFPQSQSRGGLFCACDTLAGTEEAITLRLDPDGLAFFCKHGKGYQTTINAVLRKYVEIHKGRVG